MDNDDGHVCDERCISFNGAPFIRETAEDILSDDTIVEKLKSAGVDIARRTVAKYREAMRIPSSVQRRREKQAAIA